MRYGKLLTQDKPEDLIQKYNVIVSCSPWLLNYLWVVIVTAYWDNRVASKQGFDIYGFTTYFLLSKVLVATGYSLYDVIHHAFKCCNVYCGFLFTDSWGCVFEIVWGARAGAYQGCQGSLHCKGRLLVVKCLFTVAIATCWWWAFRGHSITG